MPRYALLRVKGCSTVSAIRTASAPWVWPSLKSPNSARLRTSQKREHTESEAGIAEALVEPLADEGLDILPMVVDRLPIVAQEVVIDAQVEGRHHLQGEVPTGRGNREGALAVGEAALIVAHRLDTVAII